MKSYCSRSKSSSSLPHPSESQMAEKSEKPEATEMNIPVFSVLKKGVIVKKIVLNIPPPESSNPILIGRHPDCHIVLDHPSISRYHVELLANPSLQQLSVTDRSSVHGTWVSGNKIQSCVPVCLDEGDTLRFGASTREYRLQWVPVSHVVEMESPLAPLLEEEEEEEGETLQEENPVQLPMNSNPAWVSIPSAPPMPASDEPFSFSLETRNLSPARKDLGKENSSFCSAVLFEESLGSPLPTKGEDKTQMCESVSSSLPIMGVNMNPENTSANEVPSERKHLSPLRSEKKATTTSSSLLSRRSKSISFLHIHRGRSEENKGEPCFDAEVDEGLQKDNLQEYGREETLCRVLFNNMDMKEEETFDSDKENMTPGVSSHRKYNKGHVELQSSSLGAAILKEKEIVLHIVKDNGVPRCLNPDSPISENRPKNEREKPFDLHEESLTPNSSSGRRLKKSLLGLQRNSSNTIATLNGEAGLSQSNKENSTPKVPRDLKSKTSIVENFVKIELEEEAFASDKENLIPKVSEASKMKKPPSKSHGRIERERVRKRMERIPFQSLLGNSPSKNNSTVDDSHKSPAKQAVCSPSQSISENCVKVNREEEKTFPSGAKNLQKPFSNSHDSSGKEKMRKIAETFPFRFLEENSISRNNNSIYHAHHSSANQTDSSFTSIALQSQSANQVLNKTGEEKKRWNIVVDTSCFLDEESRRSLELLEGIKGTHLIIPKIVIRELDCLKRQECLFWKTTKASSILQWIEICMERASWWIHVQSSLEMMPVAPTPPVSPRSQLGDASDELGAGASNSTTFSTCRTLMEIVSPTAEDHILDCALLFKKLRNEGQFILLTKSITLKIKAMAEGLLCETPAEFRHSLVNPYSKRFLWVNSSPRGPTWSCSDELVLPENYHHQCPVSRKVTKEAEGAKGLKLILLHNSHYGKTDSVK